MSWSEVAVGGALVAAVTWGAMAWLLSRAEAATDPAGRVEAVKTGLGIGAGTGRVFALLLAVARRYSRTRLESLGRLLRELQVAATTGQVVVTVGCFASTLGE